MPPKTTTWAMPAHTQAKHDILRRYLGGWFPVISRFNQRVLFFDGFAGPGVYEGGQPGSPAIALEALLNHSHGKRMLDRKFVFIFTEQSKKRFATLENTIEAIKEQQDQAQWPAHVEIMPMQGTFEEVASEMVGYLREQKRALAPTLAFVDPFGVTGMPMSLLADLLSFDKCELFAFFGVEAAIRFAETGIIDEALTQLFWD